MQSIEAEANQVDRRKRFFSRNGREMDLGTRDAIRSKYENLKGDHHEQNEMDASPDGAVGWTGAMDWFCRDGCIRQCNNQIRIACRSLCKRQDHAELRGNARTRRYLHLNVDGKRVEVIHQLKGEAVVDPLPSGKHHICLAVNTKAHVPTGTEGCVDVTVW